MSSEVPDKRQDIIQLLLENKENIILTKGNIKDVMFERHSIMSYMRYLYE